MAGRAADAIVLSARERAFLEAQGRRHKTARSLSDRCQMILLCAEGLQSKEVGERLGVHGSATNFAPAGRARCRTRSWPR